jgi:hypothetical protein
VTRQATADRAALAGGVRSAVVAAGWLDGARCAAQGVQEGLAGLRARIDEFGRVVGDVHDIVLRLEGARDALQVGRHRPHQQRDGDQQDDDEQQADRRGLADVLRELLLRGGEQGDCGRGHRTTISLRMPANRSSSGIGESTRDRASS